MSSCICVLEHVFSHQPDDAPDVMAVVPESAAYCTLPWRGQAEKYETRPGCASSYNKDCCSL